MRKAQFHDPEIQAIAGEMDAAIRAEKQSPAGRRRERIKSMGIVTALGGVILLFAGLCIDPILYSGWYSIWAGVAQGMAVLGGLAAVLCWD